MAVVMVVVWIIAMHMGVGMGHRHMVVRVGVAFGQVQPYAQCHQATGY